MLADQTRMTLEVIDTLPNGDRKIRIDGGFITLPEDVLEELTDENYITRQHYSRATYAEGCHGPLCRLSEAHRKRRRDKRAAEAAGKEYNPSFRTTDRDEQLAPIVAWHLKQRDSWRAQRAYERRGWEY